MSAVADAKPLKFVVALRDRTYTFIAIVIFAGLGSVMLIMASRWGAGLSPDSVVYIGGARSLAHGRGFSLPTSSESFAPILQYPPLFSALLAGLDFAGIDPVDGATWLNVVIFAGNIFLVGLVVFTCTGSFWPMVLAISIFITGFPMTQIHSMAWSEPVFIFFELCAILFLLFHFENSSRRNLLAAGTAVGLGALSRYAGIALIFGGVGALLFFKRSEGKKSFTDAIVFLAVSMLPLGLWTARNWNLAGTVANRQFAFHSPAVGHWNALFGTVASWLSFSWVPSGGASLLLSSLALVSGLASVLRLRRIIHKQPAGTTRALATLSVLSVSVIAGYLLVLFCSLAFLDAQIPVDSRILSPLYVPLILLGLSLSMISVDEHRDSKILPMGLAGVAVVVIALQISVAARWLGLTYSEGVGYASREWKESELLRMVRVLGASTMLFSNAPDALYALMGRPSEMIPRKVNPDTHQPNHDYARQIAAMKKKLNEERGLVVYFSQVRWRWYLPSAEEVETKIGLRLRARAKDGYIFQSE